ncbi:CaiB/BaiF CoA transferase family protein [Paramagnetospirillum magnetotacticum]|uniref:CaiB/BaiF CoA transferase family protein n=1 Tax=Paramagnetospirillum magnetotacticum TaxID=188 RepID=UPI00191C222A|nr:CaiB/BaiF CoA-transferase family protein [Paramagnetospirillum magnetotacticum]
MIDFSTLLPGPLASLVLAESGADVLKVERPGMGDESRHMSEALFAMLNRGKRSIALDLNTPKGRDAALSLIRDADVLIEQFRPGVMTRLGLGWEDLRQINPRLIYCSITGYGQTGPLASVAGHDLNYQAEAGLLDSCHGLPHVLVADIMGGAYPAVLNILLALARRDRDGRGCHLDVAMADNVFPAMILDLAERGGAGASQVNRDFFMGASPRYRLYTTRDGRRMAVGAVEGRFWARLCELVDLPEALRDDRRDPKATADALAQRLASRDAAQWDAVFAGHDVCCNQVKTPEEAFASPHFAGRGVFSHSVLAPGRSEAWPALPLPLASSLRDPERIRKAPALGEDQGHGWLGNV